MLQLRVNLMDPFFSQSGFWKYCCRLVFLFLPLKKNALVAVQLGIRALTSPTGMKLAPPTLGAQSYYWTAREVPRYSFLYRLLLNSFVGLC